MHKAGLTIGQRCFLVLFSFFMLLVSTVSYALPFNIVPKSGVPLPTRVSAGSAVAAYYTVSNQTISQRNNNFVKYLPVNVTQVSTGGTFADTCGETFNLSPRGQAGSSCTLQLTVSGPVDPNDPDPHHHLFVCFPSGLTCAGTSFPLNVSLSQTPIPPSLISIAVTPTTATINIGQTQQFTATGSFANGSTSDITTSVTWVSSNTAVATITTSGLATAVGAGSTSITASLGFVTSNSATLTTV